MTPQRQKAIETRLLIIAIELEKQTPASTTYASHALSFADEMSQIHESIQLAGEYGVAYEMIVATLELHTFVLSGKAAVCLLELGLLMGYKTDRPEDAVFDFRRRSDASARNG